MRGLLSFVLAVLSAVFRRMSWGALRQADWLTDAAEWCGRTSKSLNAPRNARNGDAP